MTKLICDRCGSENDVARVSGPYVLNTATEGIREHDLCVTCREILLVWRRWVEGLDVTLCGGVTEHRSITDRNRGRGWGGR